MCYELVTTGFIKGFFLAAAMFITLDCMQILLGVIKKK